MRSRARRRSGAGAREEAAGGISEGAVHPSEDFWSRVVDMRIGEPTVKGAVPGWLVEEVKRGCRELNIDCWNIILEVRKAFNYLGKTVFKSNGNIVLRLNELILKDKDLARAVILHELVHIKLERDHVKRGHAALKHGHDNAFYSMLYMLIPEKDYERLVSERAIELAMEDMKSRRKRR